MSLLSKFTRGRRLTQYCLSLSLPSLPTGDPASGRAGHAQGSRSSSRGCFFYCGICTTTVPVGAGFAVVQKAEARTPGRRIRSAFNHCRYETIPGCRWRRSGLCQRRVQRKPSSIRRKFSNPGESSRCVGRRRCSSHPAVRRDVDYDFSDEVDSSMI